MKPPICAVCGCDFRKTLGDEGGGGELVKFADYRSLPDGKVGHPRGMDWICEQHLGVAKSHAHQDIATALKAVRKELGLLDRLRTLFRR